MDIKAYEILFERIIRDRHKRDIDFESIELRIEHLRSGDALKYEDLLIIGDDKCWPFSDYWMWPTRDQIGSYLMKAEIRFVNLPVQEEKVIKELDSIFKNIQLVSIILRFIQPIYYAIYSRPPLWFLRIERGRNDTAEYLNYIKVIRILAYTLKTRAAQVDSIVWAAAHEKGEYLRRLKEILANELPRNVSPAELIELLDKDPLRIAAAYLSRNEPSIAGYWTALAFDMFLNLACRRYLSDNIFGEDNELKYKIRNLERTPQYRNRALVLGIMRKLRNKAIHQSFDFTLTESRQFFEGTKNLLEELYKRSWRS